MTMNAAAVLERLSAQGVQVTPRPNGNLWLEPASKIPPDLLEAVRENKPAILAHLRAERAYTLADKVNDAMGLKDAKVREINRLAWAAQDLQDAGEPEEAWGPLLEEERRLGGLRDDRLGIKRNGP